MGDASLDQALGYVVCVAAALVLLRALSVDQGPRRDEALIAAIALLGRGMVVRVIAHLSMTSRHWPAAGSTAVLGTMVAVTLGQATSMVRSGPRTRLTVPAAWCGLPEDPASGGLSQSMMAG